MSLLVWLFPLIPVLGGAAYLYWVGRAARPLPSDPPPRPGVPTVAALAAKVIGGARRPVAFQALWDGDDGGWGLCLQAVYAAPRGTEGLTFLRFGSDLRLFTGEVPPWPEAEIGQEFGAALARRFGVPFWFPSPVEPDNDCPGWWEREQAWPCEACGKPRYLTVETPYLPREVCYPCHLRRERLKRLRADDAADAGGLTVVFVRDEEERPLESGPAQDNPLVRFMVETLGRRDEGEARGSWTIAGEEVTRLEAQLRAEVLALVARVDARPPRTRSAHLPPLTVTFEGRTIALDRFDRGLDTALAHAIPRYLGVQEAARDGHALTLVFRRGMTARTDHLVRALRRHEGTATVAALVADGKGQLDEAEIREALSRLVGLGHVTLEADLARLTRTGRWV